MRSGDREPRYGRRTMLMTGAALGLAAAGIGGCGLLDKDPDPPPPDPLEPLRDQARQLAGRYSAAIGTNPDLAARLTPLRDDHVAHVAELTKLIGRPLPSEPTVTLTSASPAAEVLAELRSAEEAGVRDATAACLAAPAARAAVVGSIAACRATHVEALA
jgi:hypothetical protein